MNQLTHSLIPTVQYVLSEVSRSCSSFHHAVAVFLWAWPDFATPPNICSESETSRAARGVSGGLTESFSKWWVAEWGRVGWQLHWWLEDQRVELAGRSLVPGKSLPCCLRTWGQPHLANGWYSTNAAHLKWLGEENGNLSCKWNTPTTPGRDLAHTSSRWNMKEANALHWEEHAVTHFQFKYRH